MSAKAWLQKPAQALFMIPFVPNLYLLGKEWWSHLNIIYYLRYTFFICLNLMLDSLLRRSDGVGLAEYLCSIHYRYPPQWFLNPYFVYDISLIIDLNALLESMIARVEDGGPLKYRCQTCGTTMTNRSKMKRHAEVHLNLSHTCIVCQKQFKTRNSLSVHYSQTHRNQVMSPWATTWNETKWK